MDIKEFEKITIEKKDGKRTITIDGKEMDLSNITDVNISLSTEPYIELETVRKDLLRW